MNKEKLYIVNKLVMARSVADAIKKEKSVGVDSVYIDDVWKEEQHKQNVGF